MDLGNLISCGDLAKFTAGLIINDSVRRFRTLGGLLTFCDSRNTVSDPFGFTDFILRVGTKANVSDYKRGISV